MEALRMTAKPVNHKIIIDLPAGMDADCFEVIVLKNTTLPEGKTKRRPPH